MWPQPTHGDTEGLIPYQTAADIIDWSIPVKSIFNRTKPLAQKTMSRIAKGLEKFVLNSSNPFIVSDEFPSFVTAKDHNALVTSHMIKMRGDNIGHGTNEPVHTISAGGFHIGEVRAVLVKYYGTSDAQSLKDPLWTVTTKDRFGLVTIHGEQYQIVDIGMRMLEPHELFAAQGFPRDHMIGYDSNGKKLSKAKQVARCGNAVCPPVAQALVAANFSKIKKDVIGIAA